MRRNDIIISILILAIAFMSVGFAAFSTTLKIRGTAAIEAMWNISFSQGTCSSVTQKDPTLPSSGTVSVNGTEAVITAQMVSPGDEIKCTINVQNLGTVNAKRMAWTLTVPSDTGTSSTSSEPNDNGSYDISDYTVKLGSESNTNGNVLNAKDGSTISSETLTVNITYKDTAEAKPDGEVKFSAIATYVQDMGEE